MSEEEALEKAKEILLRANERELNIDDGKALLQLESSIDESKFGDLVEAFYASASSKAAEEFTLL